MEECERNDNESDENVPTSSDENRAESPSQSVSEETVSKEETAGSEQDPGEHLNSDSKCSLGELNRLNILLQQKDNTIQLLEREKKILEKEKLTFKLETECATKEKEAAVMRFATKEKDLLDARKEKETLQKQLTDTKKEVKNVTAKFHALNDEKVRLTTMLEEKCNELRRQKKENEKLKTDFGNLEMKLKWNVIKLNQETESRLAAEKKLEEFNEKVPESVPRQTDQQRMEQEAQMILLKHESEEKNKIIENLKRENQDTQEKLSTLQDKFQKTQTEQDKLSAELTYLKGEYDYVHDCLSQAILTSAKLRNELEAAKILKAQQAINDEKIKTLEETLEEKVNQITENETEIAELRKKEAELLGINKEMSEMIVDLQNQLYLQSSKIKAIGAENELLQKEKCDFDSKLSAIEMRLNEAIEKRNDERLVLTRRLSEKTKLYETTKLKLENSIGDLEATKKKNLQIIKELNREISKYRKQCVNEIVVNTDKTIDRKDSQELLNAQSFVQHKCESHNGPNTDANGENKTVEEPSREHLVERILRLQQATARQAEKIDFLESHTMSLVTELQKKSKILHYYMLRDQAGALTSSKSDQNKTELAKYGGVMSAIYTGIRGNNQNMSLDLSLEINKKLQAVLEDTLLKNITLKENLDVMGLEIDKLTRQIAQHEKCKCKNSDTDQTNRNKIG